MPDVASRTLVAIDTGGSQFPIRIVIGQPYRCAVDDWACPIALEGLHEYLWDQHGADSFHALMTAQNLARTLLLEYVQHGGRLVDGSEGRPIDVARLFTSGDVG